MIENETPIPAMTPGELAEKLKSKLWRMEHLYKIIDKNASLVNLKLNKHQRYLYENLHTRNVIPKSRQLGITTFFVIYMLDDVLFKPNYSAVLIAHDLNTMKSIFEKVKVAWEQFPQELKELIGWEERTDNKNEIKFNNYSSFKVTLSTRGGTVNHLHISELAKIAREYPHKAEEIRRGAFPSVVPGGIISIESTSEGPGDMLHEIYEGAYDEILPHHTSKDFRRFFFSWTDEPNYSIDNPLIYDEVPENLKEYQKRHSLSDGQINWYYKTMKSEGFTQAQMFMEYPTTVEECFSRNISNFFDKDALVYRRAHDVERPKMIMGNWYLYEEYNPKHVYGIGADPAEGVGRDHSAAVLIDFSYRLPNYQIVPKVVGRYKDNTVSLSDFAMHLKNIGNMYGTCIIGVERNNSGHGVLQKLKEIYPNLYKYKVKDTTQYEIEKERYGWLTTSSSKLALLDDLRIAINEFGLIIPDHDILVELENYGDEDYKSEKRNKITNHFDLVMALAIAYEMRHYATGGYTEEALIVTEELTNPFSFMQ